MNQINRTARLSVIRKTYLYRLTARCLICAYGIFLLIRDPVQGEILQGWNFFRRFYLFHLLWAAWALDTVFQLIPGGYRLALGSRKLFRAAYRPAAETADRPALRKRLSESTRRAYIWVFLPWCLLVWALFRLKAAGTVRDAGLLGVSLVFYVCDLICVLLWCPFRLMIGNRCCTTCRIFNWDHLMMFSPMLPVQGFFSISLIVLSAAAWGLWEIWVFRYPERFLAVSNTALRCGNCMDKLCIQYCEKRFL